MSEKQYNPKDRIKNHLRRKSSSRTLFTSSATAPVSFESLERENTTESCPTSTNPFKITSPQKKRGKFQVTFCDDSEDAQDSFGANIHKPQSPKKTPTKALRTSPRKRSGVQLGRFKSVDTSLLQEFHAVDFSQLISSSSNGFAVEKSIEKVEESSPDTPIDLRLGGKLQLVSKVPFPWMKTRKSTGIVPVRIDAIDRYEGVKYYNRMYLTGQEDASVQVPTASLSILEAATLYYQFPVVPGMALYPRITSELGNVTRVPQAHPATETMFNQWVECYEQLFMSYKKGERDSFYVASAVFNVLFTKTAVSDDADDGDVSGAAADETSQSCFRSFSGQKLVALVSHTNSATREHLRSQSVDYEVIGAHQKTSLKRLSSSFSFSQNTSTLDCLASESKENSLAEPPESNEKPAENSLESPEKVGKSDESSDENDSPTKANQEWLKTIGVSPRQIKGNSARRQLSTQISDRDGLSCLLIKGSNVQALYNCLMSSDIVHEKTGPYTKIPPTLIATSPFLYGQLLSLKKKSKIISKAGTKCSEYVLELEGGPILPHCTKILTKFIRTAQLCRSGGEEAKKCVQMLVTDRHSNQGMSDWTTRTKNWNTVTVYEDCVKLTKKND